MVIENKIIARLMMINLTKICALLIEVCSQISIIPCKSKPAFRPVHSALLEFKTNIFLAFQELIIVDMA